MTAITDYPTKKAFREAVAANPRQVLIEDPSIVDPWKGNIEDALTRKGDVFVTNHPKRSWFAHVTRTNGAIKVR